MQIEIVYPKYPKNENIEKLVYMASQGCSNTAKLAFYLARNCDVKPSDLLIRLVDKKFKCNASVELWESYGVDGIVECFYISIGEIEISICCDFYNLSLVIHDRKYRVDGWTYSFASKNRKLRQFKKSAIRFLRSRSQQLNHAINSLI